MKFLADTNVLSEALKPIPNESVTDWVWSNRDEIATCSVVIGEMQEGIHLFPEGKRKRHYQDWLDRSRENLVVVDFTEQTSLVWAEISANAKKVGNRLGIKDSMIAACAKEHGFTVATRNTADFLHCGVKVINPFEKGPTEEV